MPDATPAQTLEVLIDRLLAERNEHGHWEGELSSSALSTAVASIALRLAGRDRRERRLIELADRGVAWLIQTQNEDGGWGDTLLSLSNISTTALCWAALALAGGAEAPVQKAEAWMEQASGGLDPAAVSQAIKRRYGKDHTFSVPILTVLALAGLLGRDGWRLVPQLPFELAAFPQRMYSRLRLPVVSYALPALIAIGQARHRLRPTRNPLTRAFRNAVSARTLDKLREIQPSSGGFLEATPLTSFVSMSLTAAGLGRHSVVDLALEFLERSIRADGAWPIDTNLATWTTTLSVNALAAGGGLDRLSADEKTAIRRWLLGQQYRERHPYTDAAPGGWAWTDLPGGVPDADDTPGALLALKALDDGGLETRAAAAAGVAWLLDLQNSDGGIPTFCKGWGTLPFDRSSPDLTAHTLRAWRAWREDLPAELQTRVDRAADRAVRYLLRVQSPEGFWTPLWFGNQHAPDDVNPVYGTARCLEGLAGVAEARAAVERAAAWLRSAQNADGGWGGFLGTPSSVEETSLAVAALAGRSDSRDAVQSGLGWLIEATEGGGRTDPAPIGFYFAKLWYFERLYPLIFAVEALSRSSGGDMVQCQ